VNESEVSRSLSYERWSISQSVCLGVKAPNLVHEQILVKGLKFSGVLSWGSFSDENRSVLCQEL